MHLTKSVNFPFKLIKREHSAILSTFIKLPFDLHSAIIGLENQCLVPFLSGHLRQVLLYVFMSVM